MKSIHVIWDLDGTLINSEEEVLEALKKSVRQTGLTESDQVKPFRVGPTIDKILDSTFSKDVLTNEIKSQIIKNFRSNYDNCGFDRTPAFEGVEEILKDKRFIHHIVTNKPDLATGRILEKLGWKEYFYSVITPYSFIKNKDDKRKSKTELFAFCINQFPESTFIGIGDMDTDAKAALENHIEAVGVIWGTGTYSELQNIGCTKIVKTVNDLHDYLQEIMNA